MRIRPCSNGSAGSPPRSWPPPRRACFLHGKIVCPPMSRTQTPLTDELLAYVREVTSREPVPLRRLREETENHPRASMQLGAEQGQFLHLLARLVNARRVIEVGV